MPDWLVAITGIVITAIVAPSVVELWRRRRNVADVYRVSADTEKVRVETRILEIGELEKRITTLIDKSVLGAADFIEQQRSEIVELRNRIGAQDHQIGIMSETLNTMAAQIRRLEFELDQARVRGANVHAANLRLLERIEELEQTSMPDGVITP